MSYTITAAVRDTSAALRSLQKLKKEWPDAEARDYGKYRLWIVDMRTEECNCLAFTKEGDALLYKNIAQGINIAPKKHYIRADMLPFYIEKHQEVFDQIKWLFDKHARSF